MRIEYGRSTRILLKVYQYATRKFQLYIKSLVKNIEL